MSEDARFKRIAPKNLREYLKDSKRALGVYAWIWKNMISDGTKKRIKRKFIPLTVFSMIFATAQPLIISYILDGLIAKTISISIMALLVYAFALLVEEEFKYHTKKVREWILGLNYGDVDKKVSELLFEKSMGQHLQENSTLDVSNIDKGKWKTLDVQAMLLFEGISAIATLLFTFIGLWIISWMAGAIITVVVLIYVYWSLYLNHKVMQEILPIDKHLRTLNRYRYERWEKAERVKVSGRVNDELAYMSNRFDELIEKDRTFWLWFIKQEKKRGYVRDLGVIAIMTLGIWLVYTGSWTVGLLYPLFAWTSQFKNNLWRVGQVEHQLNWHMAPVKSMIDAVTLSVKEVESENARNIDTTQVVPIEFKDVCYTYPAGDSDEGKAHIKSEYPALQNINFTIEAGQKVALLGDSGAGKTTVMRLLLRYYVPDEGVITAGGCDIRNITFDSWTDYLAYIPQNAQIFDGTIRSNLLYALDKIEKEDMAQEEIWELMKKFKVDFRDFAFRKDMGLETKVGRGGIKLSGGEAQRVMIVAAAIKKPKLMVIDEATSSLDSSSEKEVHKGLRELLGEDISALVVAHRLSTVRDLCDKFIILRSPLVAKQNKGNQIEAQANSFEELYQISSTFRRLADDQGLVI